MCSKLAALKNMSLTILMFNIITNWTHALDDNSRALYNAINKSLENKFAKLEAKFDEKFNKFENDVHSSVNFS